MKVLKIPLVPLRYHEITVTKLIKHYYKYDQHEPIEKWKRNMMGPTECHQMMVRVLCNIGFFRCTFFRIQLFHIRANTRMF